MSGQTSAAYLIAPLVSWLVAQGLKYFINSHGSGQDRWRYLYRSGSMPSAHTATLVALSTVIGIYNGVGSGLFAVASVFTLVAAYDALMVRRSGGEQGLALRKLLEQSPFSKDPLPHHALGHKPLEVVAGAVVGLGVGIIVAISITF